MTTRQWYYLTHSWGSVHEHQGIFHSPVGLAYCLPWTTVYQLHSNLLSIDAVKTLVCSFVLSRLDYCNSLLVGLPQYLIKRLQEVQNAAARSILRTPRSEHISPLLQNLHWLPINRRILHKVAALCHSSLPGPQYLSDLTHVLHPC